MNFEQNYNINNLNRCKNIKIGTLNAGGLRGKLDEITILINENEIDWLFICETQWEERIRNPRNSVNFIPGRKNFQGRSHYGTGIILNTKKNLPPFETLKVEENGNLQVWRWNGALFIGLYIPPNDDNQKWANLITSAIGFGRPHEAIYILGDLNMRIGSVSGDQFWNRRGHELLPLFNEKNFDCHTNHKGWTFRNFTGTSVVDYIFTSQGINVSNVELFQHEIRSDHALIVMSSSHCSLTNIPVPQKYLTWKFNKIQTIEQRKNYGNHFKERYLPQMMNKIRSSQVTSQEECDVLNEYIEEIIIACADEFLGRVTRFKGRPPVTSPKLTELNELCKLVSKRIDLTKDKQLINSYRELNRLRKEARKEAEELMSEQWLDYVESIENKPQAELLKIVRRAKESRLRHKVNLLKADSESLYHYANFFENQFARPEGSIDYNEETIDIPDAPPNKIISEYTVNMVLRQLPTGKASGKTGIRNELLKYLAPALGLPLAMFFNKMIKSGYVPCKWKEARIIPVPKKEGSSLISDYRPISLLESVRKVFERCIYQFINEKIEPLDIAQGGFRRHRGTQDSIAALNESIIQFQDSHDGESPVIAFMDIKAAYDSVDHILLFNKLKETGLDPYIIRVTKALFTGIQSVVSVSGVDSPQFAHKAGVLQGAILSPMLYSLYINSLAKEIREVRNDIRSIFMYADDLAFVADNNEQLQQMIYKAEQHSLRNNYRFNARKCEILNSTQDFVIYGLLLTRCTQFKYLGCIFDKKGINWKEHFARLAEKTERMLQFFKSIGLNGSGFRERTKISIFKSNIRSLYEYCLAIMPPVMKYLKDLEILQHKALTTLLGVGQKTSRKTVQVLTGIVSVRVRYDELSFRYIMRIMDQDDTFLAAQIRNLSRIFLRRKSCFALLYCHPMVLEHERHFALYEALRADMKAPEFIRIYPTERDKWSIEDTILLFRQQYFLNIRNDTLFLKNSQVNGDCKPRHFYALGKLQQQEARMCILFVLGKYPGKPRICKVCGRLGKDTMHFLKCTQKEFIIEFLKEWRWDQLKFHIYELIEYMTDLTRPVQTLYRKKNDKVIHHH